jgi:hypothetical protein
MMLEKQDAMLGKQDTMIEKLDDVRADVVGEIRELRLPDHLLKPVLSILAEIK